MASNPTKAPGSSDETEQTVNSNAGQLKPDAPNNPVAILAPKRNNANGLTPTKPSGVASATPKRALRPMVVSLDPVDNAAPDLESKFMWLEVAMMSDKDKLRFVCAAKKHAPELIPDDPALQERLFFPPHPTHLLVHISVPPERTGGRPVQLGTRLLTQMELNALAERDPVAVDVVTDSATSAHIGIAFSSLTIEETSDFRLVHSALTSVDRDRAENDYFRATARQCIMELSADGQVIKSRRVKTENKNADPVKLPTLDNMPHLKIWEIAGVPAPSIDAMTAIIARVDYGRATQPERPERQDSDSKPKTDELP